MSASRSASVLFLDFVIAFSAAQAQRLTPTQHPPAGPQEVFAPYWTTEPGWETELQLKNNLASGRLTVTRSSDLPTARNFRLTQSPSPPTPPFLCQ